MTAFAPSLDGTLDRAALRDLYRRDGRVQIRPFLAPTSAALLEQSLIADEAWLQLVNSGDKVFELSRNVRAGFTADRTAALDAAVNEAARWGFQYRFEALRVSEEAGERAVSARPLDAFLSFLCSAPVIDLLRDVTGEAAIDFADAQATRYTAGDFLTGHDDAVAGKHRVAAYAFGLTRAWRAEWGGLLLFDEGDGRVTGWVPGFNTLNLFAVPQPHSVSLVTAFAGAPRLSITGWLRTGDPAEAGTR